MTLALALVILAVTAVSASAGRGEGRQHPATTATWEVGAAISFRVDKPGLIGRSLAGHARHRSSMVTAALPLILSRCRNTVAHVALAPCCGFARAAMNDHSVPGQ